MLNRLILALALQLLFLNSVNANVSDTCDPEYLRKAYDDAHITTAANYAIYGLISNNTYLDIEKRPHFVLPEYWEKVELKEHIDTGLALDIYEKRKGDTLEEVVIAFRGTEDKSDRTHGWISNAQYEQARIFIEQVIEKYPGTPIVATGHSLGGGLAMFASYQHKGVTGIGFNASPRYHSAHHKEHNTRVILFEKGDPTKLVGNVWFPWRWGGLAAKMDIYFQKYDFVSERDHFSYPLARGLLLLGSLKSPELAEILRNNCANPK